MMESILYPQPNNTLINTPQPPTTLDTDSTLTPVYSLLITVTSLPCHPTISSDRSETYVDGSDKTRMAPERSKVRKVIRSVPRYTRNGFTPWLQYIG